MLDPIANLAAGGKEQSPSGGTHEAAAMHASTRMALHSTFSDKAKALYVSAASKGGMDGIDTEKIAQIQLETASNSAFTGHQEQLNAAVDERIRRLRVAQARLDEPQRQAAKAHVSRRSIELEAQRNLNRVCMVVDFDMCYAAVAIRDNPALADKPLAVGSSHGIVLTANYIARRWGVRSGMPGFVAKELGRRGPEFGMPRIDLTFVPPDYAKYAELASQAMDVYKEYDPEPAMGMGYDECSLDLTPYLQRRLRLGSHELANFVSGAVEEPAARERPAGRGDDGGHEDDDEDDEQGMPKYWVDDGPAAAWNDGEDALCDGGAGGRVGRMDYVSEAMAVHALADEICHEIRKRVEAVTGGLTVSAGVAPNFMLAKMGADVNKPDGQFRLGSSVEEVLCFLRDLPCRKIPHLGRVCEKLCQQVLGASTCGELLAASGEAHCLFSRVRADWLLRVSLGWCDAERGSEAAAEQKGISFSDTFGRKNSPDELRRMLRHMCDGLAKDMAAKGLKGTKMTLKLKDSKFSVRSRTGDGLGRAISSADDLYRRALPMFERELKLGGAGNAALPFEALELRSIGVQMTGLVRDGTTRHGGRIDEWISGADGKWASCWHPFDEWKDSQDSEDSWNNEGRDEGGECGGNEDGQGYALSRETTARTMARWNEVAPLPLARSVGAQGKQPARMPPPGGASKRQRQGPLDQFVRGAAGFSTDPAVEGEQIEALVEMGFEAAAAREAMDNCGQDQSKAIELLLADGRGA